jgi:hypothetical protein
VFAKKRKNPTSSPRSEELLTTSVKVSIRDVKAKKFNLQNSSALYGEERTKLFA